MHVTEEAWGEQRPHAALIHILLTADKLFSGRAAFDKAVELRRLVLALGDRDFPDTALTLAGATLDVSSGLFTRSSSVTYFVRVKVEQIDRLPVALEAIAEAKQARVTHIEWDYGNDAADALLTDCAARAVAKAKRFASALGLSLAAVQAAHEEKLGEVQPHPASSYAYDATMRMKGAAGIADQMSGLDLGPTKKVGVRVQLSYKLTG
jgi:hypothetical protein